MTKKTFIFWNLNWDIEDKKKKIEEEQKKWKVLRFLKRYKEKINKTSKENKLEFTKIVYSNVLQNFFLMLSKNLREDKKLFLYNIYQISKFIVIDKSKFFKHLKNIKSEDSLIIIR